MDYDINNPISAYRLNDDGSIFLEFHDEDTADIMRIRYDNPDLVRSLMMFLPRVLDNLELLQDVGFNEAKRRLGLTSLGDLSVEQFLDDENDG